MDKTKRSFSRKTSPRPSVVLTKGDWLDVMDQDGVWNVARVLSVPSPEEVEVMYDGWPEEYDEIVRVDSDRVAPYHTFTWAVKCWVKYLNWPMWPSVITIRTPGTADGIKNLALENRLYVDFLEDPSFAKRDRCWQKKRQVKMIDDDYDKKRMETNGAEFEGALESLLKSDATTKMPTFVKGTLPLQYENSTTESVEKMRKLMGNGLWYRNFANNKTRHMRSHIYETIGDDNDIDDSVSDEAVPVPKLKVPRPITSPINDERKPKPRKKKRPRPAPDVHFTVKIEQEPLAEVELPICSSSPKKISNNQGQDKMAARRSIPPLQGDLNLVASPKLSHSSRPSDDDWEDEEKGVLKDAVEEVGRHELHPKKSVIRRRSKQSEGKSQGSGGVAEPHTPTQSKLSRTSLSLIEQRIAFAQEVLRDLDNEKQKAIKSISPKDPSYSLPSDPHSESQTNLPRVKRTKPRPYQPEKSGMSFLRVDDEENGSPVISENRPGKNVENRTDFGLQSNQLDHSFLSVDEAYSTDGQESKGITTPCDEQVAIDTPSDPKQSKRAKKPEAKSLADIKIGLSGKQLIGEGSNDEDSDAGEEKQQEVRRHFCVMQAGLEGTLQINENDKKKSRPSKKTVITVPRKFDVPVIEIPHKTCSRYGAPLEDLAHEWVVLFQAISGGKMRGDAMPLQIPDTVLLSPNGQPSVWYTTSSTGRVKAKDLMRASPQAIFKAFQTQLPCQRYLSSCKNRDIMAVRRLGFEVDNLSRLQLKVFCRDMEVPSICLPLEPSNSVRSRLTKGVFCLQRHIPCQNNASFLIVWRHVPILNSEHTDCTLRTTHGHKSKTSTPRAHSDVFLMTQSTMDNVRDTEDSTIEDNAVVSDNHRRQRSDHLHVLSHLEILRPDEKTGKTLRQSGFDPDVVAPLLFYMKRMTSEIANCINMGHNTQQACGLACEFFVGEHDRRVYFSALRGIQWLANAPSWELLREVDSLSRSICDFYGTDSSSPRVNGNGNRRRVTSTPLRLRSPIASDRAMYEQNPRFPSVNTPFDVEKQWLHRSQLMAPDISPRYIGVSVPKIYRDGVFQSLLTAHQADSVVRLNLSPQAPTSLTEVRRGQPHLSPRSVSVQRKTVKGISASPNEGNKGM